MRSYHQLDAPVVIAWDVHGCVKSGQIPLWDTCRVVLRGFPATRYLGNSSLTAQVEARWKFHKRWGMVAFAGGGRIGDATNSDFEDDIIPSYGVGLRFMVHEGSKDQPSSGLCPFRRFFCLVSGGCGILLTKGHERGRTDLRIRRDQSRIPFGLQPPIEPSTTTTTLEAPGATPGTASTGPRHPGSGEGRSVMLDKYHASVDSRPSDNRIFGCHPRVVIRLVSISLSIVPSGLLASKIISPWKTTT